MRNGSDIRLVALLLGTVLASLARAGEKRPPPRPGEARVSERAARLAKDIEFLSTIRYRTEGDSPAVGRMRASEGERLAAERIARRFSKDLGLENVRIQSFPVLVPVTKAMRFEIDGEAYTVYPLRPNHVRTCSTGDPVDAHLVWAGDGRLRNLTGQVLDGNAVVVLEGDRSTEWMSLAGLGARAVIFIEPDRPLTRTEIECKASTLPIPVPRFWMPRDERSRALADRLRRFADEARRGAATAPRCRLECRVDWEEREAHNVYGLLRRRGVAIRVGTGGERARAHGLVWGRVRQGLQVGLEIESPSVRSGEPLALTVRVRNASRQKEDEKRDLTLGLLGLESPARWRVEFRCRKRLVTATATGRPAGGKDRTSKLAQDEERSLRLSVGGENWIFEEGEGEKKTKLDRLPDGLWTVVVQYAVDAEEADRAGERAAPKPPNGYWCGRALGGAEAGTEGKLTVLTAYYDSPSVIPDLSPGADSAASIAALLEVARDFAQRRPDRRDILFVALSGHFADLEGARVFADLIRQGHDDTLRELGRLQDEVLGIDSEAIRVQSGREALALSPRAWVLMGGILFAALAVCVVLILAARGSELTGVRRAGFVFGALASLVLGIAVTTWIHGFLFERERAKQEKERRERVAEGRTLRLKRPEGLSKFCRYARLRRLLDRIERRTEKAGAAAETVRRSIEAVRALLAGAEERAFAALAAREGLEGGASGDFEGYASTFLRYRQRQDAGEPNPSRANLIRAADRLEKATRAALAGYDMLERAKAVMGRLAPTARTAAGGRLRRSVDQAITEIDLLMDREKLRSPRRLRYGHLVRNLADLARLGPDLPERVGSVTGLDLSWRGQGLAVVATLTDAGLQVHVARRPGPVHDAVRPLVKQMVRGARRHAVRELGVSRKEAPHYVTDPMDRSAYRQIFGAPLLDAEIFQLGGVPAFSFITTQERRARIAIPGDVLPPGTKARSRAMKRLAELADAVAAGLRSTLCLRNRSELEKGEEDSDLYTQIELGRKLSKVSWRTVGGMAAAYDPAHTKTLTPVPLPPPGVEGRGLVLLREYASRHARDYVRRSFWGVETTRMSFAGRDGSFLFTGVPDIKARPWNRKEVALDAYLLDPASGRIQYASDRGEQGHGKEKLNFQVKHATEFRTITAFKCRTVAFLGATDARDYTKRRGLFGGELGVSGISLYDPRTNAMPLSFGYMATGLTGETYVEPAAVAFVPGEMFGRKKPKPDREVPDVGEAAAAPPGAEAPAPSAGAGIRFKLTFSSGFLSSLRFPLLNIRTLAEAKAHGVGYEIPENGIFFRPTHRMFRDMWLLNEHRIGVLRRAGVRGERLEEQHGHWRKPRGEETGFTAEELVAAAEAGIPGAERATGRAATGALARWVRSEAALARRDYGASQRLIRAGWAIEAQAYPGVKSTTVDILLGVIFYLFLLLPFSFFCERLLFGFPDINRQIAAFFGIFILIFIVLAMVHPAFGVTNAAPIVLLAFVTLSLGLLVMSMIHSKFKHEVSRLQKRPGFTRRTDVDRLNAAKSAFLLGISNMRRRKVRTALTLATLVLLMFSVLSFTSVRKRSIPRKRDLGRTHPPYQGVLIRHEIWWTLSNLVYRQLSAEFTAKRGFTVAPRAWLAGNDENNYNIRIVRTDRTVRLEDGSIPVAYAGGLVGVMPEELRITAIKAENGRMIEGSEWFRPEHGANVCILSQELARNCGVLKAFAAGERPVVEMLGSLLKVIGVFNDAKIDKLKDIDEEQLTPVIESWKARSGAGAAFGGAEVYHPKRLEARRAALVPYHFVMNHGGHTYSVAIRPPDDVSPLAFAEAELLPRLTVPVFVAEGDRSVFISSTGAHSIGGAGNVLVPMLVAALIVLNTMLGAVYEREQEIWIYGSLGLAPVHIGSLFLAESCVFATVATVLGYVLGQVVSKVVASFPELLPGLELNYSSLSAVLSATFVMTVVFLSTIYPARRAGQLSVPDVERVWKFPEPQGDLLVFDFPFTVSGEHALGINMHLVRHFVEHADQSVGEFYTADTRFGARGAKEGEGSYVLTSRVWVAPFDFGISQEIELETFPAEGEVNVHETRMTLRRLSGAMDAWVKMNHRFMKGIRKQFLLWRLFTEEERSFYVSEARRHLGWSPSSGEAAVPPAGAAGEIGEPA